MGIPANDQLFQVIDPSLADIVYVLNPTFTPEVIRRFETSGREVRILREFMELLTEVLNAPRYGHYQV